MRRLAVILVAACGRIGFDPGGAGPGDDGGGGFDGPSACPARDVGVGREHACMIDFVGAVWCWGQNSNGQAIPPVTAKRTTSGPAFLAGVIPHIVEPQQVPLPGPATKIAAGRDFTCALLEDGSVRCWGANNSGQLGDNGASEAGPSQPAIGGIADDIAAGTRVACARLAADRSLMCWGDSRDGELGVANPSPVPVAIPNTAGTKQISLGHRHNCAVLDSGAVRCWGKGISGQTGGVTSGPNPITVSNIGMGANVAVASTTSCGVEAGGAIKCWGSPSNGRLGDGGLSDDTPIPVAVSLPATGVEVALGVNGGCARMTDKTVSCWGRDLKGDGTFAIGLAPKASSLVDTSRIVAGHDVKCAIEGGRVACWGPNQHGQLGRGTRAIATTPVEVNLGAQALEVRVGFDHACARTATDVRCWGRNVKGEIGDGNEDLGYRASPVVITTGLANMTSILLSRHTSCALGGGQVRCWGGDLGPTPRAIQFTGTTISSAAIGGAHSCAVIDGAVFCFGKNDEGQLGNNTTTSSDVQVAVAGLPPQAPTAIVAGSAHSCALVNGVFCWGAAGRVGDGTAQQRLQATPVSIPGNVTQLAAGNNSTLAVTAGGDVYCWGENGEGECGLGDTNPRLLPTLVPLPAQAVEVSLTAGTSCVRLVTGAVTCFGNAGLGQLGNGSDGGSLDPVPVSDLANATQISAGHLGTCAIAGGKVFCWGSKSVLGDGDSSLAQPTVVIPSTTCP